MSHVGQADQRVVRRRRELMNVQLSGSEQRLGIIWIDGERVRDGLLRLVFLSQSKQCQRAVVMRFHRRFILTQRLFGTSQRFLIQPLGRLRTVFVLTDALLLCGLLQAIGGAVNQLIDRSMRRQRGIVRKAATQHRRLFVIVMARCVDRFAILWIARLWVRLRDCFSVAVIRFC